MNENTDELPDIGAAQGEMIETEAGREKTIRHGQISLLHRWWARRPNVLARIATYLAITEEQSPRLDFLAALGAVSPNASTLAEACSRVRDASWRWALRESQSRTKSDLFQVDAVSPLPPKVLDPFAGGGSIPMEANRLGCHAYAGDLSPVAYRILRATIEYPARLIAADDRSPVEGGDGKWAGLVPELRHWTGEVEQRAGRRLAVFFRLIPIRATMSTAISGLHSFAAQCLLAARHIRCSSHSGLLIAQIPRQYRSSAWRAVQRPPSFTAK